MGNRWFEQPPKPLRNRAPSRGADGEAGVGAGAAAGADKDLWLRCPSCAEILYRPTLVERFEVCTCGHHFRLSAPQRVAMLADEGTWTRHDADLAPLDPLNFVDSKPYSARLKATQDKVGENDAFLAGSCHVGGVDLELGVFDFRFMGGSMGSVVGECITRLYERAAARRVPAIVISASGGARMQEGILSLMQMAKTCAALARLRDDAGQPYISVLTHPTTGGVAASFAMLGDVILAEPEALIGFAGPRVIEQTIGETLPDGFQTSEYLLDHGMIDRIVHRDALRDTLVKLLTWMGAPQELPGSAGAEG